MLTARYNRKCVHFGEMLLRILGSYFRTYSSNKTNYDMLPHDKSCIVCKYFQFEFCVITLWLIQAHQLNAYLVN